MKTAVAITNSLVVCALFAIMSCSTQDPMPAKPAAPATPSPAPAAKAEAKAPPAEKAPEKAKATKLAGDIGLLDTEKNYLILVTKEGKLVTIDFDAKTKATQITPSASKMGEIGLGSSATVTYEKAKDKNLATGIEFKAAKGE